MLAAPLDVPAHAEKTNKKERHMDVANSLHLDNDYEDDVTPEGVDFMRRRAEAQLAGRTFRRFVGGKAVGPELTYEQLRSDTRWWSVK
jgi:hypothetical protein